MQREGSFDMSQWFLTFTAVLFLVGCSSDEGPSVPFHTLPITGDITTDCRTVCSRGVPACDHRSWTVEDCVLDCVDIPKNADEQCQAQFNSWMRCVQSSPQIICSAEGHGEWEGEAVGCVGFKEWPVRCPCNDIPACDPIGEKIIAMANSDSELKDWGRQANPCAPPIPVTNTRDYGPVCAELKQCMCNGCAAHCESVDGG